MARGPPNTAWKNIGIYILEDYMNSQMVMEEVVPRAQHIVTKDEFLRTKVISYVSCKLVREESNSYITQKITSPDDVGKVARDLLKLHEKDIEEFWVLHLNTRSVISSVQMVSRGSLSETVVHPREVFKAAILANASAAILIHNHPSGFPDPSSNDKMTTKRLVEAGKIIGIQVMDHIIIGKDGLFSFKENGLI